VAEDSLGLQDPAHLFKTPLRRALLQVLLERLKFSSRPKAFTAD
jgi:hypothetical protein